MTRKEIIYNTFIDLFQWMDASDVENIDALLSEDVVLELKIEKKRPTKANTIEAIKQVLFNKIKLGIAEEKCPTDGYLSIYQSMMSDKYLHLTHLLKFIKKWKKQGYFDPFYYESGLKNLRKILEDNDKDWYVRIKSYYIETILRQCIISKEIRIDLQRRFGQFDGVQICEHCGKLMWEGYSWDGTTYCDDACVMAGENIDRKQFNKDLENAEDPDWPCYWTQWL